MLLSALYLSARFGWDRENGRPPLAESGTDSFDDDGGGGTGDVGRTAALANGWFDLVDLALLEVTEDMVA